MDIFDKRLKPCPLCGSKEVAIKLPKVDDFRIQQYSVKCYDCGLNGFKNVFVTVGEEEAFNRIIKYWNTRPEVKENG